MIIEAKYAGMWVAIKSEKVVASNKSFEKLNEKVEKMDGNKKFRYMLVPKGLFVVAL